ncbi:hypothetical protein OSTOST_13413, partial [Ostertagia ostertagi]
MCARLFLTASLPIRSFGNSHPKDQLGILGLVLNRVLDLRSFKDYISQEGLSETARNLRDKITKLNEQVSTWQEELVALPEFEEVPDPLLLSRSEARERADIQRQRETLERKIEENKDKVEELLGKLTVEKLAKAQSKRLLPIGEDRHFRRYYWFHGKSADDGIWIQDVNGSDRNSLTAHGIKSQGAVRERDRGGCINRKNRKRGMPKPNRTRTGNTNIPISMLHRRSRCQIEEDSEQWRPSSEPRVPQKEQGGDTHQYHWRKCKDKARRRPDPGEIDVEDEDLSAESLTPLRKTIIQLASDLRDSYFTSIAKIEDFEAEVLCCTTLDEVKKKLRELADSITPSAIVRRLDFKVAQQTGQHSCLIMDRWKQRLAECHNVSGVHLLRSYLDARIDWKKSVVEKRCNSCGSRRSPEAKIACSNCAVVVHFYCTRPRLQEKPTFWLCPICERAEMKKKKEETSAQRSGRISYKETDAGNSSGDESGEDESDESESDEDDFFANK